MSGDEVVRKGFEAAANRVAPSLDLSQCPHRINGEAAPIRCQRNDFHYLSYSTQKAWDIWQASRSAAIQECADLAGNHTCRSMAAKELLRDRVLALKER